MSSLQWNQRGVDAAVEHTLPTARVVVVIETVLMPCAVVGMMGWETWSLFQVSVFSNTVSFTYRQNIVV